MSGCPVTLRPLKGFQQTVPRCVPQVPLAVLADHPFLDLVFVYFWLFVSCPRMNTYEEDIAATEPEIYLAGLKGVGTKTAERLIEELGPDMASIRDALTGPRDTVVKRLTEIQLTETRKIGRKMAETIKKSWDDRAGEFLVVAVVVPVHACNQ